MKFKLEFNIAPSPLKIGLKDKVYLAGSCFSDEIAQKLDINKFNYLSNPFGTLYNPVSIFRSLRGDINPQSITQHQDIFYHWDAHGEVSDLSKTTVIEEIKRRKRVSDSFLKQADWLIITLGTAYIYQIKEDGRIVANCHKAPQSIFEKKMLDVDSIIEEFKNTYTHTGDKLQIIFTVSPVRHIRDGLIENNLGKSVLFQAIHQLVNDFDQVHYFPSYEIVIDELRDYRFYKKDMIHPDAEAIDYVWQKFTETYFDESALIFLKQWTKIRDAVNHKPYHPTSSSHQKFIRETILKLNEFEDKVDIRKEREMLESQLAQAQP